MNGSETRIRDETKSKRRERRMKLKTGNERKAIALSMSVQKVIKLDSMRITFNNHSNCRIVLPCYVCVCVCVFVLNNSWKLQAWVGNRGNVKMLDITLVQVLPNSDDMGFHDKEHRI